MTEPETAQASLTRPFTFRYWLEGRGWADAILSSNDHEVALTASWLSDALRLLLEAVDQMLDGRATSEAEWREEPGSYRWIFTRRGEAARVRVVAEEGTRKLEKTLETLGSSKFTLVDEGNGPEVIVFDIHAPAERIAMAIAEGARGVLLREGEVGYFEKWGAGTFPLPLLHSIERKIGLPETVLHESVAREVDPRRPELITQWESFLAVRSTPDETGLWLRRQPRFDYPETTIVKSGLRLLAQQVKSADRTGVLPSRAQAEFHAWRDELAAYDSDPMAWYRSKDRMVETLERVPKRYRLEVVREWQSRKGDGVVQEVLNRLGISWDELNADASMGTRPSKAP